MTCLEPHSWDVVDMRFEPCLGLILSLGLCCHSPLCFASELLPPDTWWAEEMLLCLYPSGAL